MCQANVEALDTNIVTIVGASGAITSAAAAASDHIPVGRPLLELLSGTAGGTAHWFKICLLGWVKWRGLRWAAHVEACLVVNADSVATKSVRTVTTSMSG